MTERKPTGDPRCAVRRGVLLFTAVAVFLAAAVAHALTPGYAKQGIEALESEYEQVLMDLSDLEQELAAVAEPGTPLAQRAAYVDRVLRLRARLLQLETRRRELLGKVADLPRAPPLLKLVAVDINSDLSEDYRIEGAGWVRETFGTICVSGGGLKCGGENNEVRSLASFRIVKAPLRIRPTEAFSVVVQKRERTWYPDDHECVELAEGGERKGFVSAAISAHGISARLIGERSLGSYCDEGSTRRVYGLTESWLFKGATVRSDVVSLTLDFIPKDHKVSDSGKQTFYYTARASGGAKIRLSLKDQDSFYECDLPLDEQGYLRPEADIFGMTGINGIQIHTGWLTLRYEPVRRDDPFLTSLDVPAIPQDMLGPDREGAVRALHVVPDLAGTTLSDAKKELHRRELEYSLKPGSRAVTPEQSNTVESQAPPAGQRIAAGATVTLAIRAPYVEVKGVPDLTGLKVSAAKNLLLANGLKYALKPGPSAPDAEKSKTVASHDPVAGSQVEAGAEVTLTVYSDFVDVRAVPDVRLLSYAEAKSRLEAAGFYIETRESAQRPTRREQAGRAETQDPPAGTGSEAGKTVLVWFYGAYEPSREEQVADADCSPYPGSTAYWDETAGAPRCGCFAPLQWNLGKSACVSETVAVQQVCDRDFPGTTASRRTGETHLSCNCPQQSAWIQAQNRCVRQKTRQERVAEADCSAYPGSTAYWDETAGAPRCGCFAPLQWNRANTACVSRQTADQEQCSRDFPGSVANGRNRNNAIVCDCPRGLAWNRTNTACVRQVAATGGGTNRGRECDMKIGEIRSFMTTYRMNPQNGNLFKVGADASASEARQMGCDPARINEALGAGSGGSTGGSASGGPLCPPGQVFEEAAWGQGRCVPAGRGSSRSVMGCRWEWDTSSPAGGYGCVCSGRFVDETMCKGFNIPKPR